MNSLKIWQHIIACVFMGMLVACNQITQEAATPPPPSQTPVDAVTVRNNTVQSGSAVIMVPQSSVELPYLDPLAADGEIVVTGSSTVFPIIEQIYERFIRYGFGGIVSLSRVGTGDGIERWCDSIGDTAVDLVMASRPLSLEETRNCLSAGILPLGFAIARDEVTIFVNENNDFVDAITFNEVALLFSAEQWSDVNPDWPELPINRYIPDQQSGTFDWFVEAVYDNDPTALNVAPNVVRSSNPNALVFSVNADTNGLGFAGRAPVVQNLGQVSIVPIVSELTEGPVDTVEFDAPNPLSRSLYIYADFYRIRESEDLRTFITFILENMNRDVQAAGYLTSPISTMNDSRARFLEVLRGDFRVSGSTTVFPLAQAAQERFFATGYDGFMELDGIGSSGGIEEFCELLVNDIAIASRPIREEERQICIENGRDPMEFRLATDAFAFAVNRENTFIENLSYDDIIKIYESERWSEVNPSWPDEEIVAYMVGADTGGIDIIGDEIYDGDNEAPLAGPNVIEIDTGLEMAAAVADDPNAIGVMALPFYLQFEDVIRSVPLNGVAISAETVADDSYRLSRSLFLYADADVLRSRPQSAAYLYTLLSTLEVTAPENGYLAPVDRVINENIDHLARAIMEN